MGWSVFRLLALWAVCAASVAGCSGDGDRSGVSGPAGTAGAASSVTTSSRPSHPTGGSARVGVWGEPNPDAATLAGAAVRSLVLPQLFVAGPDGKWTPFLVAPGSDRQAADARSATVQLRDGAVWSDGSPITADDLRRSADPRFVAGVDGPAADGTLTLRFNQPLPGWRRLWSGTDVVTAPRPGLWGGPFVLASYEPGLEAVLKANRQWPAGPPFLDEVRLTLVPDAVIARQLLARGELDVVMPPAATVRTRQLAAIPQVSVGTSRRSGWWVGLLLSAEKLAKDRRLAVVASVDRAAFVGTLLKDEAVVLNGFGAAAVAAGDGGGPWGAVQAGSPGALQGVTVDLVGQLEEPMTATLQRSMQKRAHPAGARLELRNAEADRVEGWLAEGSYQAAVLMQMDGPEPCWTCRWAGVDEPLARAADAGDAAAAQTLQSRLRDEAMVLPLWRPRAVVAWRDGLNGVRVNGYALSGAWNAWEWWRER